MLTAFPVQEHFRTPDHSTISQRKWQTLKLVTMLHVSDNFLQQDVVPKLLYRQFLSILCTVLSYYEGVVVILFAQIYPISVAPWYLLVIIVYIIIPRFQRRLGILGDSSRIQKNCERSFSLSGSTFII